MIEMSSRSGLLMARCAASDYIRDEVNDDAEIFWGVVLADDMEDEVQVTVIATGINGNGNRSSDEHEEELPINLVKIRDVTPEEVNQEWTVKMNGESLDTPTFQRKGVEIPASASKDEINQQKKGILSKFNIKDNLDYPTFLRAKSD